MKAITLRGISPELAHEIEARSRRNGTSLSRAVLDMLSDRAGQTGVRRYHDLDHLFGRWTQDEADAMDAAVAEQRLIDPDAWD